MRIVNHSPTARRHSWQALQRSLADGIRPVVPPAAATSWLARARSRAQSMVAAWSAPPR